MKILCIPALALTMAASQALAAPPAPAAATQRPADEKKICRTEKMTGSLTRRSRICLTQAEWNELRMRTRRGVDELQGSASGASRCINGAMDVSCNNDLAR